MTYPSRFGLPQVFCCIFRSFEMLETTKNRLAYHQIERQEGPLTLKPNYFKCFHHSLNGRRRDLSCGFDSEAAQLYSDQTRVDAVSQ